MNYEPKTIRDHIETLARLTGAPGSFVTQVKALFSQKGIGLDTDGQPFVNALEEAFRREERIRASTVRAREQLEQMEDKFRRVGRTYVEQVEKLKQVQKKLHTRTRELRREDRGHAGDPVQVTIKGDHRTFVTKPVREELPMVPGPSEIN